MTDALHASSLPARATLRQRWCFCTSKASKLGGVPSAKESAASATTHSRHAYCTACRHTPRRTASSSSSTTCCNSSLTCCGAHRVCARSMRQRMSAYVSMSPHASAYVSILLQLVADLLQRTTRVGQKHTSAYVSIHQHTSAYCCNWSLTCCIVQRVCAAGSLEFPKSPALEASRKRFGSSSSFCSFSFRLASAGLSAKPGVLSRVSICTFVLVKQVNWRVNWGQTSIRRARSLCTFSRARSSAYPASKATCTGKPSKQATKLGAD